VTVFRATTRSLRGRRFETEVGPQRFITDHGGPGPTPPDFFVASLTACVAVYVAGYCRKAGIDATDMSVELECDRGDRLMSDFRIAVRLPQAELGPRAAAVRRVAEACLVHATIRSFVETPITVEDGESVLQPVR
jgi:uncharacterized OsmC-like protein